MKRYKSLFFLLWGYILTVNAIQPENTIFPHPDRIKYDSVCLQIEGKDVFIYSGAFHYFRVPKALWEDRMIKMKEAGFNGVETYVPWNWSEKEMPKDMKDFSKIDLKDLSDFLTLAEKYKMYVSLRPGPYICAEWSGGGYPQWMMKKRPTSYHGKSWLQSNDSTYLSWCRHWYEAVAKVAKPHQLTYRKPNTGGVIVWQIENEFNRVNWINSSDKRYYLEFLAKISRNAGISIPITTCWTTESRNVSEGYLNGVVDMVNSYPLWNVEKGFGGQTDEQLKSQSGKPLMSEELQGGWYTEVGGTPSWKKNGISPVQTQNLTMYALQRGYCYLNYYMLVGGTNFDDWASRMTATTYDYNAAIGEDGSINEKYMRLKSIGDILKKYGTKILRSDLIEHHFENSNPEVEITLRKTGNGDCFYFFRTNNTHTPQHGIAKIINNINDSLSVDYTLEPFGAIIYFIPSATKKGIWLGNNIPIIPESKKEEVKLNAVIEFSNTKHKWISIKSGQSLVDLGIYGRHITTFRTKLNPCSTLKILRIGDNVIYRTPGDIISLNADDKIISPSECNDTCITYLLPSSIKNNKFINIKVTICDRGLHHHTNNILEKYWDGNILGMKENGNDIDYQFAYDERERGLKYSSKPQFCSKTVNDCHNETKWYQTSFFLSNGANKENGTYSLHLENKGDGFLYLNGHCLGRVWESGPQQDYYLPECWLKKDALNNIVVSLMSSDAETNIKAISVVFTHTVKNK